ncbi:helix-turn-helix domain-containing protein [Parabacteroides distasonis]|jgi:transcriptional regulator|uniref:helix-turn-helix domain-containing protein n=1 Tax=Parabacteroides distasonis TaxID=823 RepID=UPI001BDE6AA8|nr:helix-turn-helix domain-containing protein [Parabacteroides distasonis]MBT1283680.1 AraC family transcriptional regulator [Parabacteroides distasonis]UVR96963.1 helix-turn-helix domain-containing protein [Parabacteroides distasonis]
MNEIKRIDTVQQYNDYFGMETLHPLVTVIDAREANPIHFCPKLYNLYAILMKDPDCGTLKYGRSIYDYQQGTMLFLAPGQVMGSDDDGQLHQPGGWLLAFHPELVRNTPLAQFIKNYSFFSYSANEALHLSEQERRTIIDCMCKIREELLHPIDKHTKSLITDNIKLLLDYCERFYDRQFETRENVNLDILARFEQTLDDYLASNLPISKGTPTVQYCADKLCLSANYLSDLLKKETGVSALKHIQQKMLDIAKERVFDVTKSISEISYELGFPYPQHFSRWFKKMVGVTPNEYRQNRNN